jgi:dTMP kinase
MALFITFEGGEGSGKSEQAMALYRRLFKMAVSALLTHEPGVTPLGKKITHWLKWSENMKISPTSELMLFNASRAQLVTEVIKPNLADGKVVICDRYADSTTAYQGCGRGLDLETVRAVNQVGSMGLIPDLTVLMDIPAEEGLSRKKDKKLDRFEKEDIAFHRKVREGFLKLAAGEPKLWLVVDARKSRAVVEQIVWKRVSQLLKRQGM